MSREIELKRWIHAKRFWIHMIFEYKFLSCYKPTPLKMNIVLEIRLVPKEMGELLFQSVFTFPSSFLNSVSAPLNSTNLYFRIFCPSCDCPESWPVSPDIANLAADLLLLLARVMPHVPSNTFLIARHETLGVCPTFLLVALDGMLLLQLSSELSTVQCTEGPTFLAHEIFGFL